MSILKELYAEEHERKEYEEEVAREEGAERDRLREEVFNYPWLFPNVAKYAAADGFPRDGSEARRYYAGGLTIGHSFISVVKAFRFHRCNMAAGRPWGCADMPPALGQLPEGNYMRTLLPSSEPRNPLDGREDLESRAENNG